MMSLESARYLIASAQKASDGVEVVLTMIARRMSPETAAAFLCAYWAGGQGVEVVTAIVLFPWCGLGSNVATLEDLKAQSLSSILIVAVCRSGMNPVESFLMQQARYTSCRRRRVQIPIRNVWWGNQGVEWQPSKLLSIVHCFILGINGQAASGYSYIVIAFARWHSR